MDGLFQDHIDKLPLSGEEVKKYQTETWQRWQEYTEPGDEQVLYCIWLYCTAQSLDSLLTFSRVKSLVDFLLDLTLDLT